MPTTLPTPACNWPIPPMDHGAGYKPSAFTWAMGRLILQRMADGETMKAITADPRMPAYATVFRWTHVIPEFGDAYRHLRTALAKVRREERDVRQRPRRTSGRRTTYTADRGEAVCEAVREGASLSEVVRRSGMPSFRAIYRWLRYETAFRANYVEACAVRTLLLEAMVEDVAMRSTPWTLASAKQEVAELQGRIGRLTPKLYRAD
jgi:hypothetical protein